MYRYVAALVLVLVPITSISESKSISYSDFQRDFMAIVLEYSQKYPRAENELQKSSLVTERLNRFRKLKGDPRRIKDWYGTLESMGTTGDGKAFVTIRLASVPDLRVSTWNNFFSDSKDKSLIPQSSKVYAKLAAMKKGNVVKFSGTLRQPTNPTEEGKMVTPNFLFIFTEIDKIGDSISQQ